MDRAVRVDYLSSKVDYFILAILASLLMVLDSTFTLAAVEHGAVEANPILNWATARIGRLSLVLAIRDVCATIGLMFLAVVTTMESRASRIARVGIWLVLGTYTLVNIYHVLGRMLWA